MNATQRNFVIQRMFDTLSTKIEDLVIKERAIRTLFVDKSNIQPTEMWRLIKEGELKLKEEGSLKRSSMYISDIFDVAALRDVREKEAIEEFGDLRYSKSITFKHPTKKQEFTYSFFSKDNLEKVSKAQTHINNAVDELILGESEEALKMLRDIEAMEL